MMLMVVTRRIPIIWVPLSLTWHSIKAYDLTLRQPWIKVHGFAAGFPVVGTPGNSSQSINKIIRFIG